MHLLFGLEHQLEKFDILHTADPYYYYSYQAAQVKIKFPEKLLISSVWETIPFNNEATSVKQRLKRFVMNKTDVFLTYSKKAWKSLIQEEIPASKIHHLSLGIDTELFIPGSHSSKEILFVGRLVPEKDPFSVLQAFVQVLKTHPDYKLRLVGSGPEEKSLREFATKHKITEHVIFEKVSYENMPGIYQQADIFVLPSVTTKTWEEQYGMALLEGMSAGLPIVTTRSGAIGEIVGNAGLYVTEKSSTEIAHSLITLIEDQSLSQKLGTIGRDRAVKHFNREIFASKLLKLYETYFSRHTRKK
jgi:glycosyltransferase involved in cell wall biosynthesis